MKRSVLLLGIAIILLSIWGGSVSLASAHAASGGPVAAHHSGAQASMHAAVFCSGAGCNHQDPYAMGCNWSMYAVATMYLDAGSVTGRVELEYSSVCQTNWAQIYSGNGVFEQQCTGSGGGLNSGYWAQTGYY